MKLKMYNNKSSRLACNWLALFQNYAMLWKRSHLTASEIYLRLIDSW